MKTQKSKKIMPSTKRLISFATIIVTLIVGLGLTGMVYAKEEKAELNAANTINVVMGINIKVNESYFQPQDANKNDVPVFVYDGTTYLPIRAMANMLGAEVRYEGETNSAYFTTTGDEALSNPNPTSLKTTYAQEVTVHDGIKVYLNAKLWTPKDVNGKEVSVYVYNGTTYAPVRAVSEALGFAVDWDGATSTVLISDGMRSGESISDYYIRISKPYKQELADLFNRTEELSERVYERQSAVGSTARYQSVVYQTLDDSSPHKQQWTLIIDEIYVLYDSINTCYNYYITGGIKGQISAILGSPNDTLGYHENIKRVTAFLKSEYYDVFVDLENKSSDAALQNYRNQIDLIISQAN